MRTHFVSLLKLEPYTETAGMNLTRRAILGVVKYPEYFRLIFTTIYPVAAC